MKNFLKQKKVFHYFSYGDRKSSIVERVNRSLQNIIYPLMYARRTHKWVELLPEMLQIYNSRKHRTINMSPENAEKDENKIRLAKTYRERYNLVGVKKPQFRKGELVRLQMKAKGGIKRREYLQSFTEDKYLIDRVLTKLPIPMYKVRKLNGDKVQGGSFYAWELSRTTSWLEWKWNNKLCTHPPLEVKIWLCYFTFIVRCSKCIYLNMFYSEIKNCGYIWKFYKDPCCALCIRLD